VLRAQRGGFTATEYARARAEYISRLEKAYKNRASRESGSYAREYASHFTSNEPIPGIEWEYQTMNMVVNQIPVEGINQIFAQYIKPDNRVLLALFPEKEGVALPTEAELAQVIAAVDAETIEAYVDNVKSEPLIANLPVAGKVVKETQNATWGTTEWTLSNGAKVIIKPTKFKEDEILMTAVAKGGTSTVGDEFANELILMPQIIGQYGLGDYTNADLQKYLAGKQVSLRPSFSEYTRQILGNTTPKDLNSLMELTYMMFTAYNITADEYAAIQNMFAGVLQNQEATPDFQFNKNLAKALYSNPRNQMLSVDIIKSANREKMLGIAKQMTANAADYTFVFVGNVDAETLKPLVEQYIASIPGDAKKATKKVEINKSLEIGRGTKTDEFTYKMETPQTTAAIISFGEMEYTDKNQTLASMAGQILSARLISTIREKEGAVYSIWAQGSMSRIANEPITIQSVFPMKPELKEKVLGMIKNEFVDMESNINEEEFNKVKEFMIKSAIEAKEKNGSWLSGLVGVQLNGVDTFNGSVETIKSITVADVEKFMKDFNKQGNYRVVILDPAQ
jgi:zinc protease